MPASVTEAMASSAADFRHYDERGIMFVALPGDIDETLPTLLALVDFESAR